MDMRMPVMNGYQATRKIKASQASTPQGEGERPKTVVIALTASAYEEDRLKIFEAGCDDMVRKPIQREAIFEILSKHLGVRYLYETRSIEDLSSLKKPIPQRLSDADSLAALRALPASLVSELRKATIIADIEQVEKGIDQIREKDNALADMLADLAYQFDYEKILSITGRTGIEL
jgi:CheY-like chemotaxis protein